MKKFADMIETDLSGLDNLGISQTSQQPDNSPPLDPLEKVILTSIIQRPLDGVDKRTKMLGFHPSQMAQIQESLMRKDLIRLVYIDRKKLFELTETGKILAENLKIPIPSKKTRGGLEHDYWIKQTVQFLRKHEFQPVCEIDGIDITDKSAGIAVEIETGKSDMRKNILKLENSRVSNCFMLATTKPVEIKLKESAKVFPFLRVLFVKDFFKLTKDQLTSTAPITP
jgi:hypothetical protein